MIFTDDEVAWAVREERINFLTHATGLALSAVGSTLLIFVARLYGDVWQVLGCTIYGATLVALYAASTLSHSFERPELRHFFRMLDQVCIFLLIAGTYTPFALAFLRDGWYWILLLAMWGVAAVGICFKLFYSRFSNVATVFYVLMGWLPVLAARPIAGRIPRLALWWLLAGGILYTIGTWFLERDKRSPYFHGVWHVFVIAASACHYIAVVFFVVPWPEHR